MTVTKRQQQVLVGVIVALAVIVLIVRRRSAGDQAATTTTVEVGTAIATVKPLTERIAVLGTVEARPGHVAEISAPQASRIVAIHVTEGQAVRAGQPLVQLDRAVALAQHQSASAAVEMAARAFQRAQRLLAEGIVPRKDVEAAAADLARARADLESAKRSLDLSTLRSPIAGIVTSLNGALDQPVDVAVPVVQVVDPRGLEIQFHVAPAEAGRITPGTRVELTGSGAGDHSSIGIASVTGINAALDTATRTVAVIATISAPTRPLKVGESLSGSILLTSRATTVVVPVEALVPAGDATVVYIVDRNGVAHATPVTIGTRTDKEASIVAGLRGGEIVITRGAYGVVDSSHVTVKP